MFEDVEKPSFAKATEGQGKSPKIDPSHELESGKHEPLAPPPPTVQDMGQRISQLEEMGEKQGRMKLIYTLVALVIILIIAGVVFGAVYIWGDYFTEEQDLLIEEDSSSIVCRVDQIICPDGSRINRIPPDCKFPDCPNQEEEYVNIDPDNDGLTNTDEEFYGTDPLNPDSDGDGYTDGAEVENGYNPLGQGAL